MFQFFVALCEAGIFPDLYVIVHAEFMVYIIFTKCYNISTIYLWMHGDKYLIGVESDV